MSETLFLFIKTQVLCIEDTTSVVVGETGNVLHAHKNRSLARLHELQKKYPLTVILSGTLVNAHYVSLPTLKKAALMIPNILEESLLEHIDDLHFVFDKEKNSQEQHLVYSVNKKDFKAITQDLTQASLYPKKISCELLPFMEEVLLVGDTYIQLIKKDSCGTIPLNSFKILDPKFSKDMKVLTFQNSDYHLTQAVESKNLERHEESYQEFFSKQYAINPGLNLLQGEFKIKNKKSKVQNIWGLSLALMSLLFLLYTQMTNYKNVQNQLAAFEKENFVIYKKAFPLAKSMISPKYRIQQWLKDNSAAAEQPFFQLLNKIAPPLYQQKNLTLNSINYQNESLSINFRLKSFEELTQLQKLFEEKSIKVNQLSALTERDEINANWRLSL